MAIREEQCVFQGRLRHRADSQAVDMTAQLGADIAFDADGMLNADVMMRLWALKSLRGACTDLAEPPARSGA